MSAPRPLHRFSATSSLAIATALMIGGVPQAQAQSFDASGTVIAGSASISTGSGTTDVLVSGNAVINWSPNDTGGGTTPILFQASGTTATFSGATDFTVLNRILPATPTRAVQFDGTVLGRVGAAAPVAGGTVYFYSPGGIIAGSSAVFDVGNLGLTSSPVAYDAAGVFDAGDFVSFGAANAGSSVLVSPGAQLSATGYVAIVAPSINNGGTIDLTAPAGSGAAAALVAADAADITFSPDGLFNISVTQGTSATGNVLVNSGSITGATAGSFPTGSHRIYLVAIPQNQAVTMAITSGSTLGFDIAAAADVDGNAVVLSGGYNVVGGEASINQYPSTGTVDIDLQNSNVTSRFSARASGTAGVAGIGGASSFASDVDLQGRVGSTMIAQGINGAVNVAGNAEVSAIDPHTFIGANANALAGDALVFAASGASIDISGNLRMVTNAFGGDALTGTSGAGTAGQITVQGQGGGSVHVAGTTSLNADAFSGFSSGTDVSSGDATGGDIFILGTDGNGTVTLDGVVTASAGGFTGNAVGTGTSGLAKGGNVTVTASGMVTASTGNAVTFGSDYFAQATASGGNGMTDSSSALGGNVSVNGDTGGAVSVTGLTNLNAGGFAGGIGDVGTAGTGTGGLAQVFANTGGSVVLGGAVGLFAHGSGGSNLLGPSGVGSNAGSATGGQAHLTGFGGTIVANSDVQINASAFGGDGANGGSATGGQAYILSSTGGTVTLNASTGAVGINADGFAGIAVVTGGTAGDSLGGSAQISAIDGSVSLTASTVYLSADGAEAARSGAIGTDGGAGTGGTTTLVQSGTGSMSITGDVTATAIGRGGVNYGGGDTIGGTGTGGFASADVSSSGGMLVTGALSLQADGLGGNAGNAGGSPASGGIGLGGIASASATGGDLQVTSNLDVAADGLGGQVFDNGNGGNGTGGIAGITAGTGGQVSAGAVSHVYARGSGGSNAGAGGSGIGTGGDAAITVTPGGTVLLDSINFIDASGFGGDGSVGAAGIGGAARIDIDGGLLVALDETLVVADGTGGSAGDSPVNDGGLGQGGQALVQVASAGNFDGAGLTVEALGRGGESFGGLTAGDGTGGLAQVRLLSTGTMTMSVIDARIVASGNGGNSFDPGGVAGQGIGGQARLEIDNASLTNVDNVSVDGSGQAGNGDAHGGNATGGVANIQVSTTGILTAISTIGAGSFALGGNGVLAGDATGGFSNLSVLGGTVQAADVILHGWAAGGLSGFSTGGTGGNALGGSASVYLESIGGTAVSVTASNSVNTDAHASAGTGDLGGNATGGTSRVETRGGDISAGTVQIDAWALGGDSTGLTPTAIGGSADGGLAELLAGTDTNPGNGSTFTFANGIAMDASAVGGFGFIGGAANSGSVGAVHVTAANGTINLTAPTAVTTLTAAASGGNGNAFSTSGYGSALANGGDAIGGEVSIVAQNSPSGASSITLNDVQANASAFAGTGGSGLAAGDYGGNGGQAAGGVAFISGSAGNGTLIAGNVIASADGQGGNGGVGSGANALGGSGGNGGGGSVQIGSQSGIATATNTGSATFASITMTADGVGGTGRSGGSAAGAAGPGGDGGTGSGGNAFLFARGSQVTVSSGTFATARGLGGATEASNGLFGTDGDAQTGSATVVVSNRLGSPTQRGTLVADAIAMDSSAVAAPGGVGILGSNAVVVDILNGDATLANLSLISTADTVAAAATPSRISVTNGTLTTTGTALLQTAGDFTLALDSATLTADVLDVTADGNWLLGTAPAVAGTIQVGNGLNLITGQDLVTYANLVTPFNTGFNVTGDLQFGNVTVTGSLNATSGGQMTLGNVSTTGDLDLSSSTGISVLGLAAGGYLSLNSGSSLSLGSLSAAEYINLVAGGAITTTGDLTAGDYVIVDANGAVTIGNVSAGIVSPSGNPAATYRTLIRSNGDLVVGTVQAAGDVALIASGGSVTAGTLDGNDMLVLASTGSGTGAVISAGRVEFADASMASLGGPLASFDFNPIFAGPPVNLGGPVTIGGPSVAASFFRVYSDGAITTQAVTATSQAVDLNAGGDLTAGALSGGTTVFAQSGGLTSVGAITSGGGAFGGGQLGFSSGTINANGAVFLSSPGGALTAGNIVAGDRVVIGASGNVSLANVVSDPATAGAPGSLANTVVVGSGGTITTGQIRANQDVALLAGGNIGSSQIIARDVVLLSGGSVTAGNILSGIVVNAQGQITNATGRVLIADISMASAGGPLVSFDFPAVFAIAPVRLPGMITTNAQSIAGFFTGYATGGISGAGIAAFGSIELDTAGLARVDGIWSSPDVTVRSGDIDIVAPAVTSPGGAIYGVGTGLTPGNVALISLNPNPALIGDGLTGTGYALSNAELGRIITGELIIGAADNTANTIDMLIGNLTVNSAPAITTQAGPGGNTLVGGTINGSNGRIIFATGIPGANTISGGMRVVGALAGTNFTVNNGMEFDTGLFELDAATGSVALTDSSNALGGLIEISADHIHMAESAILTRLEADPLYAGHIADLNTPTTVSRPGGIFSAAAFDAYPNVTFYIQNTGTVTTPAGFLFGENTDVTPPASSTGLIEVVVNGQFVTANGTLTGRAAYDALLASNPDFTGFTAQSQLNSCLFVGGCGSSSDPLPDIAGEFAVLSDPGISDSPVIEDEPDETNEQEQEEEERAVERAIDGSPIVPPAPLIDTRPLTPPSAVTEPVAGSGNPALIGSATGASNQGDAQ